ncbi:4621_t:CDS:2 [Funneliformis caledonium]|uniref:4621_t:CDS:1 n=1 Tax=Funneliformis caledonium TaxID=1117310 RepID=A0A9N9C630_9GLOM|nr:4621_t:CDS:2 [Funneliformis caledonium]
MSSFFESPLGSRNFSTFDAFKNANDLTKPVQQHLIKVYATLATTCLIAAAGSYAHISGLFLFGGGFLSFLIGFASLIGIKAFPNIPDNKNIRYGLLFNFAFMEGLSIGPLVDYSLQIDYSGRILLIATAFTSLIFGSFTLSSLLSNKRIFIYLGGLLTSIISLLTLMSLINLFIGSRLLFTAELYLGLFMFCGYVIFDTQLIIYQATYLSSRDVVQHSLELFIDLVGIFVRILHILIKNSEDNEKRRHNNSKRNNRKTAYAGY